MLAESNAVKYDYISKFEDANGRLVSLEFRQRKTANENDSLSRQLLQRQREIDEKTEENLSLRREQAAKISELQMEVRELFWGSCGKGGWRGLARQRDLLVRILHVYFSTQSGHPIYQFC